MSDDIKNEEVGQEPNPKPVEAAADPSRREENP